MTAKQIQLLMIAGVGAIALHFAIQFGKGYFDYLALQKTAKPHISQWEVVQIKDRFALKASYNFTAQEKNWQGLFTLSPPYYLNEPAAISDLKSKAKDSWVVWYSARNPQISALEKKFPLSLLMRTLICCGVLVYFITLYKRLVQV